MLEGEKLLIEKQTAVVGGRKVLHLDHLKGFQSGAFFISQQLLSLRKTNCYVFTSYTNNSPSLI